MHKPEELGLDDLPESFKRDEELANQLGMKKDVVAQLAEEAGVPIEFIKQLRSNPREYEEFMAWKAKKTNDYLDEKDSDTEFKSVQEHGSTNQEEQDTNGEKGKPSFPVAHVANPERWETIFNEDARKRSG